MRWERTRSRRCSRLTLTAAAEDGASAAPTVPTSAEDAPRVPRIWRVSECSLQRERANGRTWLFTRRQRKYLEQVVIALMHKAGYVESARWLPSAQNPTTRWVGDSSATPASCYRNVHTCPQMESWHINIWMRSWPQPPVSDCAKQLDIARNEGNMHVFPRRQPYRRVSV